MPRLAPRLGLAAVAVLAAAFGAAALSGPAPAAAASPCIEADPAAVEPAALSAGIIVIGTLHPGPTGVLLLPELFLKGTVSNAPLQLAEAQPGCPPADLSPGDRVLLFLAPEGGRVPWPAAQAAFRLVGGTAERADRAAPLLPEADLVARIRAVTGQAAVPPASDESPAGIDWRDTVLPVGAILGAVFGLSLVLMRLWHRIDPS